MAFSAWFKSNGAPKDLGPEDLRREERRLAIREDQATVRLERLLAEKDDIFGRGAATPSTALRRVLARRFAAAAAEEVTLEREILALGKELATARLLLALADGGRKPAGLAERAAELQVAFEDEKVEEGTYRDSLARALGHDPAALPGSPDGAPRAEAVVEAWRALDRGEASDLAAARRALDGTAPAPGKTPRK